MSIKLRYIIALSLIAIAVSLSAISMRYVFQAQDNDANLINRAGQQRMLSQRIALFIERLSKCDTENGSHLKDLLASVDRFEANHSYLSSLEDLPSAAYNYYFAEQNVNAKTKLYINAARDYANKPACANVPALFKAANTDTLLNLLDKIVKEFENAAKNRVSSVEKLEMLLWITTLVLLLLEIIFIFRPMEQKIIATIRSLDAARDKAQSSEQLALDANKAKSEFLASMSHELRTPLNGLFGMIDLAIDNPNKSGEYLKKAKNAGRQLLVLINDVLDLSKIEAGKLNIEKVPLDLYQMIDDVVSSQATYCRRKNLAFVYQKETGIPKSVIGDPTRISQVLHNLLSNAIKFTHSGEVSLKVSMHVKQQKHWLTFTVSDTGIGISEEQQQHIFNKFEQADQTTARLYGGTGLGLSISAKLAELLEGNLTVESSEGTGSTFVFRVPITIDTSPLIAIQSSTMLNCAIVDDLQTSREYLQHLLTQQGLKALTYNSAIDFLEDTPEQYDVIMLDLSMPLLDGNGLVEALLRRNISPFPYIIIVSAILEQLDCSQRIRNAIWRTHAKPIDRRALEMDLRELQHLVERQPETLSAEQRSASKILVAEDNEINAEVVRSMLESKHYNVTVATDGRKVIDACTLEHFDLILMDVQMPNMDGLRATQILREKLNVNQPIVALTANAFPEDRERCIEAGMTDFLVKPIDKLKLLSTVDRLLVKTMPKNKLP